MHSWKGLIAALVLCAPLAVRADTNDPLLERGFHADGSFQSLGIDHVDLFRTSLELTIPIGQPYSAGGALSYRFMLAYHSDVWDLLTQDGNPTGEPDWWTTALPSRLSNAGLGWTFTLGMLIDPAESAQFRPTWTYVSPDGAEHQFFNTLHAGETTQTGYWYSRDSSYIRMYNSNGAAVLEMPDGTKHAFSQYDSVKHLWRLDNIQDRFGNYLIVVYGTDAQGRPLWTLSDNTGRTHYVHLNAQTNHVELVDLAAFNVNGGRALYSFTYAFPKV